ncbi:MAG: 50S ribosomal protein L9, partial [Rhodobacteraceae bacterium]|nr:50S ribosomal protein L9 [Paracoccaceae bacterium]
GKALRATDANKQVFEAQKAQLEARNLETRAEAQALADKLDGTSYVVIRSASDAGALYGSVTPRDIADAATAEGFSIDRRQVVLSAPIKTLGVHGLSVVLHPEVTASISVNVARSAEEAELQASGKSIQELAAEAEAAAEFEIAELFDDIGGAADEDDEQA